MLLLSIIISILFFGLGILHLSWAFGGRYGFEASLPTKDNGERVLNPKKIDSAVVGIGLIGFAIFYWNIAGLISISLPPGVMYYLGWIIPSVFLLRAMGEFTYIGFFKKVKNTKFSTLDTLLFSPLCLLIGVLGIVIQLLAYGE